MRTSRRHISSALLATTLVGVACSGPGDTAVEPRSIPSDAAASVTAATS